LVRPVRTEALADDHTFEVSLSLLETTHTVVVKRSHQSDVRKVQLTDGATRPTVRRHDTTSEPISSSFAEGRRTNINPLLLAA
jgi:hypothetical protein